MSDDDAVRRGGKTFLQFLLDEHSKTAAYMRARLGGIGADSDFLTNKVWDRFEKKWEDRTVKFTGPCNSEATDPESNELAGARAYLKTAMRNQVMDAFREYAEGIEVLQDDEAWARVEQPNTVVVSCTDGPAVTLALSPAVTGKVVGHLKKPSVWTKPEVLEAIAQLGPVQRLVVLAWAQADPKPPTDRELADILIQDYGVDATESSARKARQRAFQNLEHLLVELRPDRGEKTEVGE